MAQRLGSKGRRRDDSGAVNGPELRRLGERLLSLLDERDAIGEEIKDVYGEAREAGFVTKILRAHVRERRMDPEVLAAQLELMQAYRDALGQLGAASAPKRPAVNVTVLADRQPAKRGRKPKPQVGPAPPWRGEQLEGEDLEAKMEDDLDRIIGEPAPRSILVVGRTSTSGDKSSSGAA